MKFAEPQSDRNADIIFRADKAVCIEYNYHVDSTDGAHCCYVGVKAGQTITIDCSLWGSSCQVDFDLFVDGVLRNSQSIHNLSWRSLKRTQKLKSGFFVKEDGSVAEGALTVLNLDTTNNPMVHDSSQKETVGVIELRVSTLRSRSEVSHDFGEFQTFKTAKDWKTSPGFPTWSVLKPTHEIAFTDIQKTCSKAAIGRLQNRTKAQAKRPGTAPWVIARFHYRTHESIRDAGMMKWPLRAPAHQLQLGPIVNGPEDNLDDVDEAKDSRNNGTDARGTVPYPNNKSKPANVTQAHTIVSVNTVDDATGNAVSEQPNTPEIDAVGQAQNDNKDVPTASRAKSVSVAVENECPSNLNPGDKERGKTEAKHAPKQTAVAHPNVTEALPPDPLLANRKRESSPFGERALKRLKEVVAAKEELLVKRKEQLKIKRQTRETFHYLLKSEEYERLKGLELEIRGIEREMAAEDAIMKVHGV